MLTTLIDGTLDQCQPGGSTCGEFASLLTGASSSTARLRERLQSLAPYFRTALITGEAGVGKRRVARELHRLSHPDGPYVLYRPAATSSPGALPGALPEDPEKDQTWADLLRSAKGGTLVVEEVGDLSPADQTQLLQILRAPGWRDPRGARAQVIGLSRFASRVLLTTGRLRPDLHAMLSAIDLRVQPLRERPEDVQELAIELLAEAAMEFRSRNVQLSPEAMAELQSRPWPGNVAELRTVLRHAITSSAEPVLTARSLNSARPDRQAASPASPSMRLQDAVDAHLCKALAMCGGNKLKTAELLGVSRSTLYRMLEGLATAVR